MKKQIAQFVLALSLPLTVQAGENWEKDYSKQDFKNLVQKNPVIVQIHKDGCTACKSVSLTLKDLLKKPEYQGKVVVMEANTTTSDTKELMKERQIPKQASLVFFKKGGEAIDQTQPKENNPEVIESKLKKAL